MVVELTFMPNVLVLLLLDVEGSPAWEGNGGDCVRGWAEPASGWFSWGLCDLLGPAQEM